MVAAEIEGLNLIKDFIDSMQEEPVNNDFEMALAEMISKAQTSVVEPLVIAAQWKDELIKLAKGKEPVSDDFKEFEVEYLEREKDNIVFVYDRHAGLVDGAQWQKEQIIAKAVDVTIAIPYPNGYGGYTQLLDSKEGLPFGENLKVLIIKQE
jgi:hypothetical protein